MVQPNKCIVLSHFELFIDFFGFDFAPFQMTSKILAFYLDPIPSLCSISKRP